MELLVLPSRRTVGFVPGDNLLDVLLRADVPVSHSCRAGRCSTCRCRVINGDVLETGQEQQRPLDRRTQTVLACQTVLTDPCTVEIEEPDEVVVHPARTLKATVTAIDDLRHDVKALWLRPNKPLSYSPGQYAQLQFGPGLARPYSMAGLADDALLEFHVRVVPDGRATQHIAHQLQVGDTLRLSGPLGSAYLRQRHTGPMLCVAGGTGLAPVLSIVRGAIAAGLDNPIHLYVGARTPRDLYATERLQALAAQHPALRVQVVVTHPGEQRGPWRTGPVTRAVEDDFADLRGFQAYLCGSPPMVEAAAFLVKTLGLAPGQIHADAFYASGT